MTNANPPEAVPPRVASLLDAIFWLFAIDAAIWLAFGLSVATRLARMGLGTNALIAALLFAANAGLLLQLGLGLRQRKRILVLPALAFLLVDSALVLSVGMGAFAWPTFVLNSVLMGLIVTVARFLPRRPA